MKAQTTAIFATVATLASTAAFAACIAFGISSTQAPQTQSAKAPQKAVQTVTFTETEVPKVLVYRKSAVTTVNFSEKEVPAVLLQSPTAKTVAER